MVNKNHISKKSKSKDDMASGITIIDFSLSPGLNLPELDETTENSEPTEIQETVTDYIAPQLENMHNQLLFQSNIKSYKKDERGEKDVETKEHGNKAKDQDIKLGVKAAETQSTYRQSQETEESTTPTEESTTTVTEESTAPAEESSTPDAFADVLSKLPNKDEVPKRIRISSHSYKYDIVYEPHGQVPTPPVSKFLDDSTEFSLHCNVWMVQFN